LRALAPVKYYAATSLEDACKVLNDAGGKGKILAGGSDIILAKKEIHAYTRNPS
jgi:CO/xanthine dehydrogenase FAD-binding subunit